MGRRGEIYSTRIFVDEGRKTFFFNVKENRFHDRYLNIVESRKTDSGFRRSSLVVFQEDITRFREVLNKALGQFRERGASVNETLSVGGGRRRYEFNTPPAGKPALKITEIREDASGRRRESLFVAPQAVEPFLHGMNKALNQIKGEGR